MSGDEIIRKALPYVYKYEHEVPVGVDSIHIRVAGNNFSDRGTLPRDGSYDRRTSTWDVEFKKRYRHFPDEDRYEWKWELIKMVCITQEKCG